MCVFVPRTRPTADLKRRRDTPCERVRLWTVKIVPGVVVVLEILMRFGIVVFPRFGVLPGIGVLPRGWVLPGVVVHPGFEVLPRSVVLPVLVVLPRVVVLQRVVILPRVGPRKRLPGFRGFEDETAAKRGI